MKNDIIKAIRQYPDFPIKNVKFIDLSALLFDVTAREALVEELVRLAKAVSTDKIDFIISPDARGFIWGSLLAKALNVGFIPVRKAGKLPDAAIMNSVTFCTEYSETTLCLPRIEIGGKRILFVDDVYATGGTYDAVKQMAKSAGAVWAGGVVVLDIELKKSEDVRSVFKGSDLA